MGRPFHWILVFIAVVSYFFFLYSYDSQTYTKMNIQNHKQKSRTPTSLDVFLDLYMSRKFHSEWEGDWEIFFDSTCPLRYLGMKMNFLWDGVIFHEFELSCLIPKERPSLIYMEADPMGRVVLNNQYSIDLKPGKLYLGLANLFYWKKNHILFKNPRLYNYGKD